MPATIRGRTACHQCRSRKQKCDEKRPVCSRCRDLNKTCQWPDLRKRGPAKGYTEALEHRLSAAETALLRLLSVVNSETLEAAFRERASEQLQTCADTKKEKTELLTHWEQFPLTTAEDVTLWANELGIYPDPASMRVEESMHTGLTTHIGAQNVSEGTAETEIGSAAAENGAFVSQHKAPMLAVPLQLHENLDLNPESDSMEHDSFEIPEQFQEQYLW